MKKTKNKQRNAISLDLPPDLQARIDKIAEANELPRAVTMRMCLTHGLPLVEKKLMSEPAALPA